MEMTAEQKKTLFMIVILGVLGFGGGLWYWFMFEANSVELAKTRMKASQTEKKVYDAKLKEFADFKRDIEGPGELAALEKDLDILASRLPKTEEAFGFFEALNDILRSTGISNERLEKEKTNPEVRYTEIPYSVRAVGRYHEFGQFLDLVENNSKRFMRVKTFKITDDSKRPTLHPIEVDTATYMLVSHD